MSLASRKQDTAGFCMAGFPGRQLGILGFLISSAPGRGSLKEGHRALHGSALILLGLQSRGQSRGLTCGWEQGRPGPACWKSAAEPPAIPKFPPSARWDYIRLPRHALQPYPRSHSFFHCPGTAALLQFLCRLQNGWAALDWKLRGQFQPFQP